MNIVYEFFTVTTDSAGWSVMVPEIRELWGISSQTLILMTVMVVGTCIAGGVLIWDAVRTKPERTESEVLERHIRGLQKALDESPTFQSIIERKRRAIRAAVREQVEAQGPFKNPEDFVDRMTSQIRRVKASKLRILVAEAWPLLLVELDISAFFRKLPEGQESTERALELALEAGLPPPPDGMTFVRGHERAVKARKRPL